MWSPPDQSERTGIRECNITKTDEKATPLKTKPPRKGGFSLRGSVRIMSETPSDKGKIDLEGRVLVNRRCLDRIHIDA